VWKEWNQHFDKHSNLKTASISEVLHRVAVFLIVCEISDHLNSNLQLDFPSNKFQALCTTYRDSLVFSTLSKMIEEGSLGFPFKKFYMQNPLKYLERLKNYQPTYKSYPFKPNNVNFFSGDFFPFTFDGTFKILQSKIPDDYNDIDIVCDYFQEEQRLKARRQDSDVSPYEWWTKNNQNLFKELLHRKLDLNTENMRETLYGMVKECTQFKPTVAYSFYKLFKAQRILDISAGWGDRLIAAIAADAEVYVGVDPNLNLQVGHSQIIQTLAKGKEDHFKIVYSPFQTAVLPETKFDLIFTSPPFFDFEIYTDLKGQSVLDHPKLNDWLVQFLFKSIDKAWQNLVVGGHMALHITDVYKTKIVESMNLFIQATLEGAKYNGVVGCVGQAGKIFPVWVWEKMSTTDERASDQAHEFLKQHFTGVAEALGLNPKKRRPETQITSNTNMD